MAAALITRVIGGWLIVADR